MGLWKKIAGLIGVPDWSSGSFKTLVVDDNGTLTKRNIDALGIWDAVTIKTADTDVTGTTYTDVTDVSIDLEADSEYEIEFFYLASQAVANYSTVPTKWQYSGTYEFARFASYSINGSATRATINGYFGIDAAYETDPTTTYAQGLIKTTTAGTLKLQLAGNEATHEVTIHAGSVFKVKKLDTFTNFQPSSGEANTGTNVGGEKEVYKSMSGMALQFRTLKEGTGVTLTQNTNDITIDVASGGFYDGFAVCTADQSVTGNTLTDSAYLTVSLDATSTYLIRAVLYLDDNASSNQAQGNFAYTGTIDYSGIRNKSGSYTVGITSSSTMGGDFNKAKGWLNEVTGMITTTTSGTFKLQFANQFGTGTVYLRKGSILYYKKII